MKRSQMADAVSYPSLQEGIVGPTCIHSVDGGKCDEHGKVRVASIDTIETQANSSDDCRRILAAVDKMRKDVLRIMVTPDTLQCTPYRW